MNQNEITKEEILDLKSKEYILKNINFKNDFHIEFVSIMLIKGFGYTPTDIKEKELEKIFRNDSDFKYRSEIGKLIEKYLSEKKNFNLLETKVLDTKEELLMPQIRSCAENIYSRLSFGNKIANTPKNIDIVDDSMKELIKKVELRMEECLKILNNNNY